MKLLLTLTLLLFITLIIITLPHLVVSNTITLVNGALG